MNEDILSKTMQFVITKLSKPRPPEYKLEDEERNRLLDVLSRAPSKYPAMLDSGTMTMDEPALVEVHHNFRDVIVVLATRFELNSAVLGFLLIELSAALLANGLTREKFLENAEYWYDSIKLSRPDKEISAKGGSS